MSQSVGPLHNEVYASNTGIRRRYGKRSWTGANPLVLLRRTAFVTFNGDGSCDIDKQAVNAVLKWAEEHRLGQEPDLLAAVVARREQALRAQRDLGRVVVRLHAAVQWRLGVGLGSRENAYEIGLALHGTYGMPVIPGSSLKGLAAAWAREKAQDPTAMDAVFGAPRPGQSATAKQGEVHFLDALPLRPAKLARDVLTPHAQPYYRSTGATEGAQPQQPVPPAEYHNPIPVPFLTVRDTVFAVDLVGRDAETVKQAAHWCTRACDDLGAGGKTAAGYGYLTVKRDEAWPDDDNRDQA